jgi:hypothetical protein
VIAFSRRSYERGCGVGRGLGVGVHLPRAWRGGGRWTRCWARLRAVSAAGIQKTAVVTTPNDHLIIHPDCRVPFSVGRSVDRGGGCPGIRGEIISPASIQVSSRGRSEPCLNNHYITGP